MRLKQNKQIERLQREFAGSRWLLYSTPFLHAVMTNWYPHHHDVRFSRAFILFRVGFVLNCRYWGLLQKLLSQSITGGVKASCPSWATSSRKQMMTACGINCYILLQTEIDYWLKLFYISWWFCNFLHDLNSGVVLPIVWVISLNDVMFSKSHKWDLNLRLDQLTEPLAVRSGMGKLPSNEPGLSS